VSIVPICAERTNTVNLEVPGAGDWAVSGAAATSAARAANAARIECFEDTSRKNSTMISPGPTAAYTAARARAARLDRSDRGRLLLTGADRRSYLQGLLTNDIAALEPGRGCYAAYLTPQGRMIADMLVYELGDAILITSVAGVGALVLQRLDELVFAEDVQVADISATHAQFAIVGPAASTVVPGLLNLHTAALENLPEHGCVRHTFDDESVIVTRITDPGVPGFEVYAPAARAAEIIRRADAADVPALTADDAETLRIEAGIPRFGRDMDEDTIPLEAGIEDRAISFTKGCYVGQEVIVRVLHRGHGRVARRLVGLRVDAATPPAAGAAVIVDSGHGGRVTSATWSPIAGAPIALAYVPRESAEPGTRVTVGEAPAVVIPLPVRAGG
jgi:folate-binding protein YgfZ